MTNDITTIVEYLFCNHKSNAKDISDSIEMLKMSLEDSYDEMQNDVNGLLNNKDLSRVGIITTFMGDVLDIQNKLDEYLTLFEENNSKPLQIDDDEYTEDDDETNESDQPDRIDYSAYCVDNEVPHMLSEDYQHKKICGFMLNGIRYNVATWQDALVTLCNVLSESNSDRFSEFCDMSEFKGTKVSYFSKKYVEHKNFKLKKQDVYVWINQSANSIRLLMRKILRQFNINANTFYIYLRADYSALHISKQIYSEGTETVNQEKIGKYVRGKMRQLSAENYVFDTNSIKILTDKELTKQYVGANYPLLKPITDGVDISLQTKSSKGVARYWNEVFIFGEKKYLVTSQWFDYNRDGFDKWFNSLTR